MANQKEMYYTDNNAIMTLYLVLCGISMVTGCQAAGMEEGWIGWAGPHGLGWGWTGVLTQTRQRFQEVAVGNTPLLVKMRRTADCLY